MAKSQGKSGRSAAAKAEARLDRRGFLARVGAGGAAVAAASTLPTPAISQGRKEWRLASAYPKNAPGLLTAPNLFAEYVNKASAGRLSVKVFGAGEIVPAFETADAVSAGTIDMGQGYPTYWAGKLPALNFLGPIPMLMTAQEITAWYIYGGGQELADKLYGQLGLKFFQLGNVTQQGAGWYNREIKSMADFKGLKMRIGGLGGQIFRAAGATPVSMPLGEVIQAMTTGAIDAVEFVGPYNDLAFGLHKVAKFAYGPGWIEPHGMLDGFINIKTWEALPADLKEIVSAGCIYATAVNMAEYTARNGAALLTLAAEQKVSYRLMPDEVLKAMGELSGKVVTEIANKDALSKEVLQSLMKFRRQVMAFSERELLNARALDFKYIDI